MKRALWLSLTLSLTLFFVACGGSPATPTLDVTSRDATSIAWQMATIEARNALATRPVASATSAPGNAEIATLTPQPSATPQPTATPSEPLARLLPDYDQVNVRSGPGTDYIILGQLQPNVTVRITGRNSDGTWWQIDYNSAPGWVIGQLVETQGNTAMVQPQQVAPAPTLTPDPQPYVLVKTGYDYVNVRSGPARSYDVIGRLQPNTLARVIGRNADSAWWQIDYEGAPRWIDGGFVDLRGEASTVTVADIPALPASASAQTAPNAAAQAPAPAALSQAALSQSSDGCPTTSNASFELLERAGPASDRPDRLHGDLNLSLRGYNPVDAPATLVDYTGGPDADGPQFMGMFQPSRAATIQSVYRVNLWHFEPERCPGALYGCAGAADTGWPVSLIGLATTPGELISIPARRSEIGTGYQAFVLYADTRRITLTYTRQDNISFGYTVYIEDVCVDPNLLALYRAQNDANGWRSSTMLPALRNGQPLGSAFGTEIRVAIRDRASFMDPRARNDWWQR